jgi:hypothetical protein
MHAPALLLDTETLLLLGAQTLVLRAHPRRLFVGVSLRIGCPTRLDPGRDWRRRAGPVELELA